MRVKRGLGGTMREGRVSKGQKGFGRVSKWQKRVKEREGRFKERRKGQTG